jgi:replicative DNA helicase
MPVATSTATVSHRQPPQDLEAEMGVLGSMLIDRETIGQVIEIIPPDMSDCFYLPAHRLIYEALVDMYSRNQAVDIVILQEELARRKKLDEAGGSDYLVALSESVPAALHCEYYARIVRDKGILRDLIRRAAQVVDDAYNQELPTDELLDKVAHNIFEVTEQRISSKPRRLAECLDETFRQIESREGQVITGVPTGFTELDELTSGFQPGELIIVAGRPSMGKTALGLALAEHVAVDENLPVGFFSMEMSYQQIAMRLLSARGGVDSHRMRRGMISDEEVTHLALVCGDLGEKPLFVDDTPGMSVLELRARARRLHRMHEIRVIFVDYLQLMCDLRAARENRQQEISSISRGLKALARELHIPVVAMAQLNRNPEGREGNRPRMSDLRESGAIEQDADVVILLHREAYYKREDPDVQGKAELIIAKQRNGPVGKIELHFDERLTRFGNLAHAGYAAGDYGPSTAYETDDGASEDAPF